MMQNFLAIDGALRNFGLAKGYIAGNRLVVTKLYHVASQKTNRQGDTKHVRKLAKILRELTTDVDIVFAESSYGSKSANAAWSLGITLGLIASINRPIQFVTPKQAKSIAGGGKTKWDMIKWAYRKWPDLNWQYYRGKLAAKNEHCADACAIAVAGLKLRNARAGYYYAD